MSKAFGISSISRLISYSLLLIAFSAGILKAKTSSIELLPSLYDAWVFGIICVLTRSFILLIVHIARIFLSIDSRKMGIRFSDGPFQSQLTSSSGFILIETCSPVWPCGRSAVRNRYFSFNFDSIATINFTQCRTHITLPPRLMPGVSQIFCFFWPKMYTIFRFFMWAMK